MTNHYKTRSATWLDVPAIVDLRNASSQDTRGTDVSAVHWQKRHWYESGIDPETDTRLVLADDMVVAYAEVSSETPNIVHEMVGAVHPDFREEGLGSGLVGWAENQVQERIENAPRTAAIFMHNSIFESNQPGRDLLRERGFKVVREFVYLRIAMNQKPPAPDWPTGITIRPLEAADWTKVGPALSEAFRDHWGNIEYKTRKKDVRDEVRKPDPRKTDPEAFDSAYFNSPGLCFVAWDGDQTAGSCLCNARTVEFPEAGYIGSLSVRRPWRKRGIGYALTLHALNAFYARGTRLVLTDTDGDSLTKAYRVYQNAGMDIFRKELVYEKTIRPGRDFVKRDLSDKKQDDV